jgi:hypothetical protein
MFRRVQRAVLPVVVVAVAALSLFVVNVSRATGAPTTAAEPFADSRMIIETNETAGDAGFQIFADTEPSWRSFEVFRPDGKRIVNFTNENELRGFGLNELFTESNEPPFETFPLEKFTALFPAGTYQFRGVTTDGRQLVGSAKFSHAIPRSPVVTSPAEGATADPHDLVVRWQPSPQPKGVRVVGYQIIVEPETPGRSFQVNVGASASQVQVPEAFFERSTSYNGEVLAIDVSGNQTITEFSFKTK